MGTSFPGYPDSNMETMFGPVVLPKIYGKGLSALEIASSGSIILSVNDFETLNISNNESTRTTTFQSTSNYHLKFYPNDTNTTVQTGDHTYTSETISGSNYQVMRTSQSAGYMLSNDVMVTGAMTFAGNVEFAGPVMFGDTISVAGTATLDSNLVVTDHVQLNSDLSVVGAAELGGSLSVGGDVELAANLSVLGNTEMEGSLSVTGDAYLAAGLSVAGDTLLLGELSVSDIAVFKSSLSLGGLAVMTSTLSVADATVLASTLSVSGETNILGALSVEGDVEFANNLSVQGATEMLGTLSVNDMVYFTSNLELTGTAVMASTLSVNDSTFFSSNMSVFGNTDMTGSLSVGSEVYINNLLSVNNDVHINGQNGTLFASTIKDSSDSPGDGTLTLDVGTLLIQGNLDVAGTYNTVDIATTSIHVEDKLLVLATASNYAGGDINEGVVDGTNVNDGAGLQIAGIPDSFPSGYSETDEVWDKSLKWNLNGGFENMGYLQSDMTNDTQRRDDEPFWELKGGAFHLSADTSSGTTKYGFRINPNGELEIIKKVGDASSKRVAKFGITSAF